MKQVFGSIVSFIALIVFYLEMAGKKVPLIPEGYKAGFYTIFVLGLIACSVGGIGANATDGKVNWASPFAILGCIFGVIALALFYLVVTNKHLWFIQSDKDAMIAIGVIIVIKWLITLIHGLTK